MPKAFTRHAAEIQWDVTNKYRRLRILYNRIGIFGNKIWYDYWFCYKFDTALGPRNFVCTTTNKDKPEEFLEFWYEDDKGNTLFKLKIDREWCSYDSKAMTERQIWLAIYELEELSYKLLEGYNE